MPKNRLLFILCYCYPIFDDINYSDLYENFVEILEQLSADDLSIPICIKSNKSKYVCTGDCPRCGYYL